MRGQVTAQREAAVRGRVGLLGQKKKEVDAVVDTGFTDHLTMPATMVEDLELPFRLDAYAVLADGSSVRVSAYDAWVEWHGQERPILVFAVDGGPLLGMAMLYGSRLTLDVVDGGSVVIEALARRR